MKHESALQSTDGGHATLDTLAGTISPEDFDQICEESMQELDEDVREVVLLRLVGHSNKEIADKLQCTVRRIERKLQLARETWKHENNGRQ